MGNSPITQFSINKAVDISEFINQPSLDMVNPPPNAQIRKKDGLFQDDRKAVGGWLWEDISSYIA